MIWKLTTFSLFVCILLVFTNLHGAEMSGVDIFIQACKNQGLNNALIRSGYAEMDVQEFRRIDVASEKLRLERVIEEQKKMFKDDPDTLKTLITSLEEIINGLKGKETNYFRYAILFKGNDPGTGLRRVTFDRRFDGSDDWNPDFSFTRIIRGDIQGKSFTAIRGNTNNEVRISLGNYQAIPFQKFGRIQDMFSKTATISMLDSGNLDRFIFLPDKVEKFKKMLDQLASQSRLSILQIVGSTLYDGGTSNAIILESKNAKGVVYMRYWIDPSRGYVCPLSQQFDTESGKPLKEYTARNFFHHEKSGLWYPQEYEEKTWGDHGNVLLESKLYQINPATFQINQPVSDEEFYIDVATGMSVVDDREDPKKGLYTGLTYRANENGSLSLADGGLDLSEMPWLERSFSAADYELPKGGVTGFLVRFILTISVLVLIFMVFYLMWLKKQKTSPIAVLFLPILVFAIMGCSKKSASMNSSVFAEPAVLDFGSVRPTDSPVKVSFSICNNSDKCIHITNVLSGCGCTVIDIPSEPIPPGGRVTLETRINLWGHFGVFENDLVVKTTTETDVRIQIRGNIETDIWPSETSIRCTVVPKERYATTFLTLYNVKYPNIVWLYFYSV